MTTLAITLALLVTVASSLALGVVMGYYVIFGILNAFQRNREQKGVAPALVATRTNP